MQCGNHDLSNEAPNWAFSLQISPYAKLVLLFLTDRASENHVCWPSIADIAKRTGMTRDRISFVIGKLEAAGLLEVHRTPGQGRGRQPFARVAD
jgi:DNA-binding MarR family transcriptional regulator